jgi:hypothetical protein
VREKSIPEEKPERELKAMLMSEWRERSPRKWINKRRPHCGANENPRNNGNRNAKMAIQTM